MRYLDRFARSLRDALRLLDRIEAAGGQLIAVEPHLDPSTPYGRGIRAILLSIAEMERERARDLLQESKARAVRLHGIHPGPTPFGYRREGRAADTHEGGRLVPDPHTAPLVAELFERRARGESWVDLGRWLESTGAVTQRGRTVWSNRAVKDIVRNEVYTGVVQAGTVRREDAHPAIVDRSTWEACQYAGTQFRPRSEQPAPLGGLLRCAGCRRVMRAELRRLATGDAWHYSCRTTSDRGEHCSARAAIKDDGALENAIVSAFLDALPRLRAAVSEDERVVELDQAVANAERTLKSFATDVRAQAAGEAYFAGLEARQEAVNTAPAARARVGLRARVLPPEEGSVRAAWPGLKVAQRRALLGAAIRCVFVRGSARTAPLDGRLRIVTVDQEVDLPRKGRRDFVPRPYDFN